MKLKNLKLSKKILLPLTTLALIATPIATVVSCGNKEKTAEENQKDSTLISGADYLLEKYTATILKTELNINDKVLNEKLENAWNFWAGSQLMSSKWFWTKKVTDLKKNGNKYGVADFKGKWMNAKTGKLVDSDGDAIKPNIYPTWALAQKIIEKDPTLGWKLNLLNYLLVERYLTSFKDSEYKKVYKKEKDEPKNLDKKESNFFLIKYLHENRPTFIWKQSVSGLTVGAISQVPIKNDKDFNGLAPRNHSLLKIPLAKSSILQTSNNNGLSFDLGNLYNYKGMSSAGISKGELDYTDYTLRKRLNDNMSESGWVTKDGNIESETKAIINGKTADTMFAMQFLPWFEAHNKDGKRITDTSEATTIDDDKSFWRLDSNLTGYTKDKDGKSIHIDFSNHKKVEDAIKAKSKAEEELVAAEKIKVKTKKEAAIKAANKKIQDANKIIQEFGNVPASLEAAQKNMQRLIFTLAQHDSGLITNARKFMLDIRKYNLRTNNKSLKGIFVGKDISKK